MGVELTELQDTAAALPESANRVALVLQVRLEVHDGGGICQAAFKRFGLAADAVTLRDDARVALLPPPGRSRVISVT